MQQIRLQGFPGGLEGKLETLEGRIPQDVVALLAGGLVQAMGGTQEFLLSLLKALAVHARIVRSNTGLRQEMAPGRRHRLSPCDSTPASRLPRDNRLWRKRETSLSIRND